MIVENTRELLKKLDEGEIDFALVEGFSRRMNMIFRNIQKSRI